MIDKSGTPKPLSLLDLKSTSKITTDTAMKIDDLLKLPGEGEGLVAIEKLSELSSKSVKQQIITTLAKNEYEAETWFARDKIGFSESEILQIIFEAGRVDWIKQNQHLELPQSIRQKLFPEESVADLVALAKDPCVNTAKNAIDKGHANIIFEYREKFSDKDIEEITAYCLSEEHYYPVAANIGVMPEALQEKTIQDILNLAHLDYVELFGVEPFVERFLEQLPELQNLDENVLAACLKLDRLETLVTNFKAFAPLARYDLLKAVRASDSISIWEKALINTDIDYQISVIKELLKRKHYQLLLNHIEVCPPHAHSEIAAATIQTEPKLLAARLKHFKNLTNEIAEQLIEAGYADEVFDGRDAFPDFPIIELADQINPNRRPSVLVAALPTNKNLRLPLAEELISEGQAEAAVKNITSFRDTERTDVLETCMPHLSLEMKIKHLSKFEPYLSATEKLDLLKALYDKNKSWYTKVGLRENNEEALALLRKFLRKLSEIPEEMIQFLLEEGLLHETHSIVFSKSKDLSPQLAHRMLQDPKGTGKLAMKHTESFAPYEQFMSQGLPNELTAFDLDFLSKKLSQEEHPDEDDILTVVEECAKTVDSLTKPSPWIKRQFTEKITISGLPSLSYKSRELLTIWIVLYRLDLIDKSDELSSKIQAYELKTKIHNEFQRIYKIVKYTPGLFPGEAAKLKKIKYYATSSPAKYIYERGY